MSSHDPMIGLVVHGYVVRSKLAEGGMGAVYVAVHERLPNLKKVIKVLLAEYSNNEIIRQRFEREAAAASRLKNANTIEIDNFGTLPDGQLFLMMPFLEGKSLEAHIRQNGRLTQHHTVLIIVQVCRALQRLHEAGIIHRDLKPGNIFVTHTNDNPYEVTLIDLGIARDMTVHAQESKTQTGMAMGTPGYMAVEQYRDAGSVSATADIYAAAIIVWEMLTGQMPWGVHDDRVLYFKQMTEVPEPPAGHGLPPELFDLLRHALSPNPRDRPATARAFAVALASLTPAIPPHTPSGGQILMRFAREFVQNTPLSDATVRNSSKDDHAVHALWPYRSTQVPELPQEIPVLSMPVSAPVLTPPMAATANERPMAVPHASHPTTLSASSGVAIGSVEPTAKRSLAVLAAIGAAVLAGVVTFALITTSRSESRDEISPASSATSEIDERAPKTVAPIDAGVLTVVADAPIDAAAVVALPDAASPHALPIEAGADRATDTRPQTRKTDRVPAAATKPTPKIDQRSGARRGSAATFDPDAVEE